QASRPLLLQRNPPKRRSLPSRMKHQLRLAKEKPYKSALNANAMNGNLHLARKHSNVAKSSKKTTIANSAVANNLRNSNHVRSRTRLLLKMIARKKQMPVPNAEHKGKINAHYVFAHALKPVQLKPNRWQLMLRQNRKNL